MQYSTNLRGMLQPRGSGLNRGCLEAKTANSSKLAAELLAINPKFIATGPLQMRRPCDVEPYDLKTRDSNAGVPRL